MIQQQGVCNSSLVLHRSLNLLIIFGVKTYFAVIIQLDFLKLFTNPIPLLPADLANAASALPAAGLTFLAAAPNEITTIAGVPLTPPASLYFIAFDVPAVTSSMPAVASTVPSTVPELA